MCSAARAGGCRVDDISKGDRGNLLKEPRGHLLILVEVLLAQAGDIRISKVRRRADESCIARDLELLGCVVRERILDQLIARNSRRRPLYRTDC